jgi:hypothetical protein
LTRSDLPPEIRDRTPAPHSLRVGIRRADLPSGPELAAFFERDTIPAVEIGAAWIRLTWAPGRDHVLVVLEETAGPMGFDHALTVESTRSKSCFLAAYFVARRCQGVVQVRQRGAVAAAAFAEKYLDDEDLDKRWECAITP